MIDRRVGYFSTGFVIETLNGMAKELGYGPADGDTKLLLGGVLTELFVARIKLAEAFKLEKSGESDIVLWRRIVPYKGAFLDRALRVDLSQPNQRAEVVELYRNVSSITDTFSTIPKLLDEATLKNREIV